MYIFRYIRLSCFSYFLSYTLFRIKIFLKLFVRIIITMIFLSDISEEFTFTAGHFTANTGNRLAASYRTRVCR